MKPYLKIILLFAALALLFPWFGCGDDDDDDDSGGPSDDDDDDDNNDDNDDDNDDDTADPFDLPISQTLNFEDLTDSVDVLYDEYGVPHIYGSNNTDIMFVAGYVHALDRFFQMDFLRHNAKGRLAEYLSIVSDLVLPEDIAMRAKFMSLNGEMVYDRIVAETLDTEMEGFMQAYADGVNAYIGDMKTGSNGVTVPADYDHILFKLSGFQVDYIPEWTISDMMAIARLQQEDLSTTIGEEVRKGLWFAALPAGVYEDVVRFQPTEDTVIVPGYYDAKGKKPSLTVDREMYATRYADRLRKAYEKMPGIEYLQMMARDKGSNNWIVDSAHTSTGNAMLLNDPHLGYLNPSVFYEIHFDTMVLGGTDSTSSYGVSFPGLPSIMIGMNEDIAWGVTMAGYDTRDVYMETLNDTPDAATAVYYNDAWVDIEYSDQVFKLGPGPDAPTQTVQIPYVPHHGPFLYGSVEDSEGMTTRWTGLEPTNDLHGFVDLMWAEDVDDFFDVTAQFQVGAQNFVAIDSSGAIGYNPHEKVPIRDMGVENVPPWMPMPGEGDYEWTGYIADPDLPQAKNPAAGYIITANNDFAGTLQDNDPNNDAQYLTADRGQAFRAKRIDDLINEGLSGKSAITLASLQAVQNDTLPLEAERFLPILLNAATNEPGLVTSLGLTDAITRLTAWDFKTSIGITGVDGSTPTADEIADSVATTIFYAFYSRMPYATFADEFDDTGCIGYDAPLPSRWAINYLLENTGTSNTGETLFDDCETGGVETMDQVLLQTLADALEWCESADGFDTANMNEWNWGKIHTTQWEDFFAQVAGPLGDIKGPYPIDGADYTVDVAGSSGFKGLDEFDAPIYDFTVGSGAQVRWAVEATSSGMEAKIVIPGGQSGHKDSDHFNDQAEMYLTNQTHDVHFTLDEVNANAVRRVQFAP